LVVEADVDVVGVALLISEGAENGYVFQHCEKGLRNLNARPFHASVGPGVVSDFVSSEIFHNLKKEKARKQDVPHVLCISLR
jgi:hypothetical protein